MRSLSRLLLAGAGTCLLLAATVLPAQGIYRAVEGTVGVDVPGVGTLPREIIWEADGSEMVLIPGGTYTIGMENPTDRGATRAEGPAVTVTVSPFYIDRKEVEHDTYMRIAAERTIGLPRGIDAEGILRSGGPIVGVTFNDALTYAQVLRKDLPTEAEWEVAARGINGTLFPWGDDPRPRAAALARGSTGTPDARGANPQDVSTFGVFDVAGNVAEWTKDYYERDYYQRVAGSRDPVIDDGRDSRTIRGGSYRSTGNGRLTTREALVQSHTRDHVGFRTVFRIRPREVVEQARATPTPTPTPRVEEQISDLAEQLLAIFRAPATPLPSRLAPASFGVQMAGIPFVNPTSHTLLFGFYEQRTGSIHGFPTRLSPGEVRNLTVPREMSLAVLAYPVGIDFPHVAYLGVVNTVSNPLVIVPENAFQASVSAKDGTRREPQFHTEARQVYERNMRPQFHEFRVSNSIDMPVEITLKIGEESSTHVLEPGELLVVDDYPTSDVEVTARYIGTTDERTSNVLSFRNDSSADFRVVIISPDTLNEDLVRVGTRRLPTLALSVQATRIAGDLRTRYIVGQ